MGSSTHLAVFLFKPKPMPISPTHRLDAVNLILSAIGLAPIAHLVDEADTLSVAAEQQLDAADREIQGAGWWFNTFNRTFTPNADDTILIPGNVLYLDATIDADRYTSREGRLFNLVAGTFVFTGAVTVKVTELIPFDELPEVARALITAKASRRFAGRHYGDAVTTRELRGDEQEAYLSLRKAHIRAGNHSIFPDSILSTFRRGGPIIY